MNRSKMAADILRLVGGKENVASVTNCMTRLRFQLKDHKKADVEALKRLDGVQGVVTKNGQFQVVIGTDVGDVCTELKKLGGFHSDADAQQSNQDGSIVMRFFGTLTAIFQPHYSCPGWLRYDQSSAGSVGSYPSCVA